MRYVILIGFLACSWGFPPKAISIKEAHYPVLVENSKVLMEEVDSFIKKVDPELEGQNAQLVNVWIEVKRSLKVAVEDLSEGLKEELPTDKLHKKFYNLIVTFKKEPRNLLECQAANEKQIQQFTEEAESTANSLFSKLSNEYFLHMSFNPIKGLDGSSSSSKE